MTTISNSTASQSQAMLTQAQDRAAAYQDRLAANQATRTEADTRATDQVAADKANRQAAAKVSSAVQSTGLVDITV